MAMMAEKCAMTKYASHFQIIDHQKGVERRLRANENVLAVRNKWPLIVGTKGSETEVHCKFRFEPQAGAPAEVKAAYADFCNK